MKTVKTTKCRQMYTQCVTRKGRQIPPATDIVGVIPHLAQRGILIQLVYSLKLGTFRVPGD